MEEIISVKQLSKSYDRLNAVQGLDLSVTQGSVFGLLGANGAGKSTTIECMLGTRKPDAGTVSILGMSPLLQRKQLFENVGVQFQEANYQDKVTVSELCEVTQSLYKNAADYGELLKQFGIFDKAKSMVKELSGGQRQKLFIVLALIPQPKVVFLDELTTGNTSVIAQYQGLIWILQDYRSGDLVAAAKAFAGAGFDLIEDENIQAIVENIRQDMTANIYQSLVDRGLQLWNAGNKTEAMDYFQASLTIKPDNPEALFYVGRLYQDAGDTDNANSMFDKVVNEFPDSEYVDRAKNARGY